MEENIETTPIKPSFGKDLPGFGSHFGRPVNFLPPKIRITEPKVIINDLGYFDSDYDDDTPSPESSSQKVLGQKLFISALNIGGRSVEMCEGRLTPLRELLMMRWMNVVTDKENWDVKILDDTIVAKWKAETLTCEGVGFTEAMFEWCVAELRWKASIYRDSHLVTVFEADVVKSDIAIPQALNEALSAAVDDLERATEKDWHPGSGEKVLDLVHPSLFPLVYGQTRILPDSLVGPDDCIERCGEGMVSIPPPADKLLSSAWSRKFQWLPCNVDIKDGAKITSYINNLHPEKYKPLYAIIEQIIDKTVPLWNATLTPLKTQDQKVRIPYPEPVYRDIPEDDRPTRLPDDQESDFAERCWKWEYENRGDYLVQPEPVGKFKPPHDNNEGMLVDLRRDYGQSGLQVIVKLANIHLTPENPRYEGGSWHVEGQLNERICASAIYYHSAENITDNYLSFQQHLSQDVEVYYEQNHIQWLEVIFGCEQDGPTLQNIGHVLTRQGRLVTFPNTLLHLVEPFQLADPSRPGHRKILALFLVDPHIQILSTANIPCQRRDWWAESVRLKTQRSENYLGKLPSEIWDMIVDMVEEFPLTLKEAKVLRQELMDDRTEYTRYNARSVESFSLCEH